VNCIKVKIAGACLVGIAMLSSTLMISCKNEIYSARTSLKEDLRRSHIVELEDSTYGKIVFKNIGDLDRIFGNYYMVKKANADVVYCYQDDICVLVRQSPTFSVIRIWQNRIE